MALIPPLFPALRGVIERTIRSAYPAGIPQSSGQYIESPAVGLMRLPTGAVPIRGEAPADYQRTGTNVRRLGFERHPTVQACVRIIADTYAAVPYEAYRKLADGKEEVVAKHPVLGPLARPSDFINAYRLRALLCTHYLLYGNAFWFLRRTVPETGKIIGIQPVHPEDVMTVYVDRYGTPLAYTWRDLMGYIHTDVSTDFVHFRDLSGRGLVFGYPRAATALLSIAGDSEASQYVRQVVNNDGSPSAVMLTENGGLTAEQATEAEDRFYQKMVDRGQRGRVAWLGGIKDVKVIGFNLQQLEFPDLRRVSREDICASFLVDPRMVGNASAVKGGGLSNGGEHRQSYERLINLTVEPIMRSHEAELDLWYTPEFGDIYVRSSPQRLAALIEDPAAISERAQKEFQATIISREEARVLIKRPSDIKPTDTLWVPGTGELFPAGIATTTEEDLAQEQASKDAAAQAKAAALAGGGDGGAAAPAAKPVDKKAAAADSKRTVTPELLERCGRFLTRGLVLSVEQRQLLWAQFDSRATREESEYRRAATMLFADERKGIAKLFDAEAAKADAHRAAHSVLTRDKGPADDRFIAAAKRRIKATYGSPDGEYHRRWLDRYRGLIGKTYAAGGAGVADRLGISFDVSNANVATAIGARAERLAQLVTDTTGQQITDAIAAGRKAGMGIRDIAKLVDTTVFGGVARSRSVTIARTETVGALNQGEFDTAKAAGVMRSKEWLTQQDARVRDTHAEQDGERVGLDDEFPNGLQYPGDPQGDPEEIINCRCTLLWYDEEA